MKLFIKLAWRNLFRNKRRTVIAGIMVGLGLASLMFTDALFVGMEKNMVRAATASFLGEGQIHRKGFRQTQEVELTINNHKKVIDRLNKESLLDKYSVRVTAFGMINSPASLSAVNVVGINPKTERYLSQIDEAMQEGSYFEGGDLRDAVIGRKLSEILEVGLGDRVVVTVAQAESGDLYQEMFRISGIYHFNVSELDKGLVFVRIEKAQEMLGLKDRIHEIALKFNDMDTGRKEDIPFWSAYSDNGNEAVGWPGILPELKAAFDLTNFSILITALILFGVVALGIVNTLIMSLHERMFEFGVLRAIGTRPLNVARLIVFEAAALSLISMGIGLILGFVIIYIISITGIDYKGIEFAGITIREMLYPQMRLRQFMLYPVSLFLFSCLVGVYPAVYAARMKPADAMRRSI